MAKSGLLDMLLNMMQQSPSQAPQGQPAQPTMGQQPMVMASNAPIGNGLAASAADIKSLYAQWQQLSIEAQMNGGSFPPFTQWAAMQGANTAALGR